jgi:hypothetical protein
MWLLILFIMWECHEELVLFARWKHQADAIDGGLCGGIQYYIKFILLLLYICCVGCAESSAQMKGLQCRICAH